jgi:hypothetical protein
MRVYHLLAVAFVGMCLACGTPSGGNAGRKVWAEKELSDAVKGRTYQEVKALLGTPDSASNDPEHNFQTNFTYDKIIRDVNSGDVVHAYIQFHNKRATGVVR